MNNEQRLKALRGAKPNSWIAFSADETKIVAAADTYADVVREAGARGEDSPVVLRTPENWLPRMFPLWA